MINKKIICSFRTGSRAYGTNYEFSDEDMITIFAVRSEDLIENFPRKYEENNTTFYELGKFGSLLIEGDVNLYESIFTEISNIKQIGSPFFNLYRQEAKSFLNRELLEIWLVYSNYLFNKAIRTAKLQLKPNIKNHVYYTHLNTYYLVSKSITEVEKVGKLDPHSAVERKFNWNHFGLEPLRNDTFAMYEDYTFGKDRVNGLFDENNELIEQGVKKPERGSLGLRGIVWFDRKRYEKEIRWFNLIKEAKVCNGYSTKSMYHAFRILKLVRNYLKYQHLTILTPNKPDIMMIREGNVALSELQQRFKETQDEVLKMLQYYDGPSNIDVEKIKDIIKKTRELTFKEVLRPVM